MNLKVRFTHLNAWIYERTGGRVGGNFGGHRVLLLTTTGRKSGQPRRTPVQYEEIDGRVMIVAAGGGSPRPPQWFLNIEADPGVVVQTGRERWRAEARVAGPDAHAELWRRLTDRNPLLEKVRQKAGREIPVVELSRDGDA